MWLVLVLIALVVRPENLYVIFKILVIVKELEQAKVPLDSLVFYSF